LRKRESKNQEREKEWKKKSREKFTVLLSREATVRARRKQEHKHHQSQQGKKQQLEARKDLKQWVSAKEEGKNGNF